MKPTDNGAHVSDTQKDSVPIQSAGQQKAMFTMCRGLTPPLTHVEIPRLRNATELNNDGMIKFVDVLQYNSDLQYVVRQTYDKVKILPLTKKIIL